mgnify:CR=1 FL=1
MPRKISTHTLTWSVTCATIGEPAELRDFNSHAHVERDHSQTGQYCRCDISTHTLTWSVTNARATSDKQKVISTHTLTWSVTSGNAVRGVIRRISTHTLTWSVTGAYDSMTDTFNNFNSHAHVERDMGRSLKNIRDYISTHTLTWSVTQSVRRSFVIDVFQLTRSRGA